ncbi:MAG TPA: UbiA family prenyltransferase [Candidatus Limnocylindrales bacterium]
MGIAIVAGASPSLAARLGLGMLGIQFAIGSINDVADIVPDSIGKPTKPIPSGFVRRGAALAIAIVSAALGCAAAASVGAGALALAVAGLADGMIYDLRLKRSPLAWAPFAAGVGLLPVYAWWGARGSLPVALVAVAGVAVVAGAALALANAYADVEADTRAGIQSVATLLGPSRTLFVNGLLVAAVDAVAVTATLAVGAAPTVLLALAAGCALALGGLSLAAGKGDRWRPLLWEVQAAGFALAGGAWLAALVSAGVLGGQV